MNMDNPHLLLTNGRSGSNMLRNILQSHEKIMNYGEVLGPWTPFRRIFRNGLSGFRDDEAYLQWIYRSRSLFEMMQWYYRISSLPKRLRGYRPTGAKLWRRIVTLGVKEFYTNLVEYGCKDLFMKDGRIHLVALFRENTLRRYISWIIAEQTGEWVSQSIPDHQSVQVDISHLMESMPRLECEKAGVLDFHRDYPGPKFLIRYETFVSSPQTKSGIQNDLLEFLGAGGVSLNADFRKVRRRPMKEFVGNFTEVREALKGTDFEKYLD